MRTLVWMTHSFRLASRLTSLLEGECSFVYYSPYHFAGERERLIYQSNTQENLDAFYFSINAFDAMLKSQVNGKLHVYRETDPVEHINQLIAENGFDQLVIDQPLFAMWHTIDLTKITCPIKVVDSDLIDATCFKMTAKSRWLSHIEQLKRFVPHDWNKSIYCYNIANYHGRLYPDAKAHPLMDRAKVLANIHKTIKDYHATRDHYKGQTGMSVALHNGIIDPANIFYAIAGEFTDLGLESPAAAILRQQAFREISIIQARRADMTLENTPMEWAKALMHHAAYDNLVAARPLPGSALNIWKVIHGDTGDKDLNFLIKGLYERGTMPNRARMFYASKVFYSSATGADALETLINTFDLIGLDGQSPNNYTQCIGAYGLSYGKVLKMNRDTAFAKLGY